MKTILLLAFLVAAVNARSFVNLGPEGRISGGKEVKAHSLPYQIGYLTDTPQGMFWCGGSLIASNWILTAAHCIQNADQVLVFVGAHNIENEDEEGQIRFMSGRENFVIHDYWNPYSAYNDIALIYVPEGIETNENVQTIRLPSRSEGEESMEGSDAFASGWGRFSDILTRTPSKLMGVSLSIISEDLCNEYYDGHILSSHICTNGSARKSTCSGDSGGPLAMDLPTGRTLVGITSFGSDEGCQIGWPSVFTRVGSYLDWISLHTGIEISP